MGRSEDRANLNELIRLGEKGASDDRHPPERRQEFKNIADEAREHLSELDQDN